MNNELRTIEGSPGNHYIESLVGGTFKNIKEVIENFNEQIKYQPLNYYYQLDGKIFGQEGRVSNRNPAYIFEYKGRQYQINYDTSRKAMHRLANFASRLSSDQGDLNSLLKAGKTHEGIRCLRLASFESDENGNIASNGFYCYDIEDFKHKDLNE
jgi:hypothetical protein